MDCKLQHVLAPYVVARRAVKRYGCGRGASNSINVDCSALTCRGRFEEDFCGIESVADAGPAGFGHNDQHTERGLDVEYFPASRLSGRYVLVYLTSPSGSSFTNHGPDCVMRTTESLCSPLLTASPRVGTPVPSASSSTGRGSSASLPILTQEKTGTSPSAPLCPVASLLSRFCIYFGCQTESRDAERMSRFVVLEVRQGISVEPRWESLNNMETRNRASASFGDAGAISFSRAVSPKGVDGAAFTEDFKVNDALTDLSTADQKFGGWFYLENSAAYRCVIQKYNVSSWPAILLFDPAGELLTARAYDHIEREISTLSTSDDPNILAVVDSRAEQHMQEVVGIGPYAGFRSGFPWMTPDAGRDEDRGSNAVDDEVEGAPLLSLVRWLLRHARRVGESCEVGATYPPEDSCNVPEQRCLDSCMDGATHLALYFGAVWHPATKRFLPKLKRLWSAACEGGDDCCVLDDDAGRNSSDGEGAAAWEGGKRALSAFVADTGSLYEPLGIESWRRGMTNDVCASVSTADSDAPYIPSRCSAVETPMGSPKEHPPSFQSPTPTVEGPLVSPRVVRSELAEEKQPEGSHHFQVVFVSCDMDVSQLKSSLTSMPSSWLFVSSVLAPQAQGVIRACLEFFDVRVFPRLVVLDTSHRVGLQHDDGGLSKVWSRYPIALKVVRSHGERSVLNGSGLRELLSGDDLNDNVVPQREASTGECGIDGSARLLAHGIITNELLHQGYLHSMMRSVLGQGGSLFVLCCIGSICPDLHQECVASLREACTSWAQETGRFSEGVPRHTLGSLTLGKPSQMTVMEASTVCAGDLTGPATLATVSPLSCFIRADLTISNSGRSSGEVASPPLERVTTSVDDNRSSAVYFVDAISLVRGHEGNSGEGAGEGITRSGRRSELCTEGGLSQEDKSLLQEYVISEVLEANEHFVPPFEGEPFLVYLQWPERRVDVLRRIDDSEPPLNTGGPSARSPSVTASANTLIPASGTPSPGAVEVGAPVEVPRRSPLCSSALVKSFIVRCNMKRTC
ncbi:hypothetical protein, conserved [Trypanosoma brucei gambiense DAL972]|uniref:Thioredoxin domain-containing protein n=1 Tax=Trypanosoma brucei gambiense (strain MHOM/CI/86/DAL972) TaxID=679716 RepID=C9ZL62_TRYB9|nr:hypothetical protein, conserved [Trypanosoma brucei gambiense DAL972]CBH10071.1 hypothetical protein, conserved [Trypanosoma brucei gambiense DAL972]|eukprot:XP_011772361.1 hypothetical protein, conserved [Trypanosoma brucei gambiense DAL972]